MTIEQDFETVENMMYDNRSGFQALSRIGEALQSERATVKALRDELAKHNGHTKGLVADTRRIENERDKANATVKELREAVTAFVAAFDERFKPIGLEDVYPQLQALATHSDTEEGR